ncbi:MAG: aminopeptidase P family N-terminal domain-containing protein, partial [Rhodospirillaceae bacterium]|nr:aminopeptidase P family N-terminal domain-containing protein [Rhodospirillaceae bacterium]
MSLLAPQVPEGLARRLQGLRADLRRHASVRGPADRLKALRTELKARGYDGLVVPRASEFPGEDLPPAAERLAWLTGFTGSAGVAVVLAERAAIFVDGRYTLQVAKQVDGDRFVAKHLIEEPPTDWVKENLPANGRLAFDPR